MGLIWFENVLKVWSEQLVQNDIVHTTTKVKSTKKRVLTFNLIIIQ